MPGVHAKLPLDSDESSATAGGVGVEERRRGRRRRRCTTLRPDRWLVRALAAPLRPPGGRGRTRLWVCTVADARLIACSSCCSVTVYVGQVTQQGYAMGTCTRTCGPLVHSCARASTCLVLKVDYALPFAPLRIVQGGNESRLAAVPRRQSETVVNSWLVARLGGESRYHSHGSAARVQVHGHSLDGGLVLDALDPAHNDRGERSTDNATSVAYRTMSAFNRRMFSSSIRVCSSVGVTRTRLQRWCELACAHSLPRLSEHVVLSPPSRCRPWLSPRSIATQDDLTTHRLASGAASVAAAGAQTAAAYGCQRGGAWARGCWLGGACGAAEPRTEPGLGSRIWRAGQPGAAARWYSLQRVFQWRACVPSCELEPTVDVIAAVTAGAVCGERTAGACGVAALVHCREMELAGARAPAASAYSRHGRRARVYAARAFVALAAFPSSSHAVAPRWH